MDIVFILGDFSKWLNNEIRFSLRSIEKHLKNYRDVYIVGHNPGFLKDIIHIPCEENGAWKEKNIFYKTLCAANAAQISEDFLFFNDDHFLVSDFDVNAFPYFYKGTLLETINTKPFAVGGYWNPLRNTNAMLQVRGYTTLNYDHHSPIIYNKEKIKQLEKMYDWTVMGGYILKSLYGNTFKVEGIYEPDCKINQCSSIADCRNIIDQRKLFSIGDNAINAEFTQLMNSLYPNPSRWEI